MNDFVEQSCKYQPLPFVNVTETATRFWAITNTGLWSADCLTGRGYAELAVRFMAENDAENLLGKIVEALAVSDFGGIETGFVQRIAELSVKGYLKTS